MNKNYPSYLDYPLRESETILTPVNKKHVNKILLYYQRTTDIDDKMLYKKTAQHQEIFMRDKIGGLIKCPIFTVGTHRSKSIDLPVYCFIMRNGIKIMASYNFYIWTVSVELPKTLPEGTLDTDLFTGGVKQKVDYYYGFKKEWEYDCYNLKDKNCTKFSITLSHEYKFYTFIYILNKAFNKLTFQDNRNEQEIINSIENIYENNGVYEINLTDRWGTGIEKETPIMDGSDVLWWTYYKYSKLMNDLYNHEIMKNPSMLAKAICSNPELKQEFLTEEFMFNTIF